MFLFGILLLALANAQNVTFTATPAVLTSSPANVTLTWSDLGRIPVNYTVGIYLGPIVGGTLSHVAGIVIPEFQAGSMTVLVVNTRMPMFFRLCAALSCSESVYVAISNSVTFESFQAPTTPRLSFTQDPSEMLVMFTSNSSFSPPQVMVGTSPEALTLVFNGTSNEPYVIEDMCSDPANNSGIFFSPGFQHAVLLQGLENGIRYYYSMGGAIDGQSAQVWSDVYSFKSHPGIGPDVPTSTVIYGDMGVYLPYTNIVGGDSYEIAQMCTDEVLALVGNDSEASPGMVLHVGDISYALGYPFTWEWFFNAIAPVSSQVAYMVGIGNHEYDYLNSGQPWAPSWAPYLDDSGGECGVPYSSRFTMPPPPPEYAPPPTGRKNLNNLWYSFDYGAIHFLMMSTEHDFLPNSTQYNFINADLASVNRSVTPWIVFMGHRTMYTSVGQNVEFREYLANSLEPLFNQYHVDLAVWGHVHQYERSCGITYNGTCARHDEQGTVHIVAGTAGNTAQLPWVSQSGTEFIPPNWIVFRTMEWGFGLIEATATELVFTYHGYNRDIVHDTVTLTK